MYKERKESLVKDDLTSDNVIRISLLKKEFINKNRGDLLKRSVFLNDPTRVLECLKLVLADRG